MFLRVGVLNGEVGERLDHHERLAGRFVPDDVAHPAQCPPAAEHPVERAASGGYEVDRLARPEVPSAPVVLLNHFLPLQSLHAILLPLNQVKIPLELVRAKARVEATFPNCLHERMVLTQGEQVDVGNPDGHFELSLQRGFPYFLV
jgi:hypothetical protein